MLLTGSIGINLFIFIELSLVFPLTPFALRCLNDFKTKYVAIETDRRRQVENLQQSTNPAHLYAHESLCVKA